MTESVEYDPSLGRNYLVLVPFPNDATPIKAIDL